MKDYYYIKINAMKRKEVVVGIFKRGKFELLVLKEMTLKGMGEVSCYGVNVILTSVQEMERAREVVAVLLNDVWLSAVVKSGCVSFRIL